MADEREPQAGAAEHEREDARADEQDEESFPASDAPASWAGPDRPPTAPPPASP